MNRQIILNGKSAFREVSLDTVNNFCVIPYELKVRELFNGLSHSKVNFWMNNGRCVARCKRLQNLIGRATPALLVY